MKQTGSLSRDGKTLKLVGDVFDPQTGKDKKFIRVLRIDGPDKHVDTMFEGGADGTERQVMEITFTRRAAQKEGTRQGRTGRKKAPGSSTKKK
jgi:hypothetical protein